MTNENLKNSTDRFAKLEAGLGTQDEEMKHSDPIGDHAYVTGWRVGKEIGIEPAEKLADIFRDITSRDVNPTVDYMSLFKSGFKYSVWMHICLTRALLHSDVVHLFVRMAKNPSKSMPMLKSFYDGLNDAYMYEFKNALKTTTH